MDLVFHLLKCIVHVHVQTYSTYLVERLFRRWTENLPLRHVLYLSNYIGLYHTYQIFHFRAQSFIHMSHSLVIQASHLFYHSCVATHTLLFRRPIQWSFKWSVATHTFFISRPIHSLWLRRDNPIIHCTSQSSIVHTLQSSVAHPSLSFSLHASHSRIVHTSHPSVVHASQSFSRSCISLAAWSLLDLVFSLTWIKIPRPSRWGTPLLAHTVFLHPV